MDNPFQTNNLNTRKIKSGKNLAFEEAFMDLQNEDADGLDDEREELNYRVLGTVAIFCLIALFGRIFYLEAVKGAEYKALAEGNKLRVQYVLAPRGLLLDQYGKLIAGNVPNFELVAVTSDLPKDTAVYQSSLAEVAQIIGKDPSELSDNISRMKQDSFQAQTLVQDITKDQALVLISKQDDLKGFVVQNNAIRDYKDPLVFSHLVGYTGKITTDELAAHQDSDYALNDYIGKTGLEYQYEQYLRGEAGKRQSEIDAQGNFKRTLAEVPAVPGNNVKLNIDYDLQKVLYDSLVSQMNSVHVKKGAVVATDPQTGQVLALISMPSFDNNLFAQGISQDDYLKLTNNSDNPLLNRAISGQYPPGSTIKPVMATAGLTEGVITTKTKILDDGVIRVGSFTFYGYEHGGLGLMDIYSAIAKSSDIYFYTVGGGNLKTGFQGLGPDKIAAWFHKFNLGKTLGIDLPGEKPGLVPDPAWKQAVQKSPWYLGDTYHESIGQGDVLATPLQINSWTSTIANGGKVMQPYILDEVDGKDGEVLAKGAPKALAENIFDPNVIKIVQDGMRQTVTDGSGRALNSLPIPVSAKTGTAQYDAKNLSKYHAWFTSYAPSDNPQIAITVLIEGGGEGYSVAGPVAKAGYAWWAANRYKK
ncbi:MAG: penicillin-binding protein 2 [Candidatus Doudnabacteria bacterium]